MLSLAMSPLAPVLGHWVPVRGPARLLLNSHARTTFRPRDFGTRVTTTTGDVFDVNLASVLEWQLWAFGCYERHLAELFGRLVRPGDRCVDVGANVGVHTVRLGRLAGQDGEVIAIEPDPDAVRRARRNIALNGLSSTRIVQAAASDEAGERLLYRPGPWDTNRASASLVRHPYLTGASITVPAVTVDDVCDGAPVALIKIDVEGHEASVLRGAAGTIARYAPSLVFECPPAPLDDTTAASFQWLAERGYQLFRVRTARRGITGRERLALEHVPDWTSEGGDFLAVSGAGAASISSLVR